MNRRPLPYHGSALPTELRGRSRTRIATESARATVPGMQRARPTPCRRDPAGRAARRRRRSAAIYNHYVTESTALFDLVPRTLDEQVQWIDEHSGGHPAVVAVDDDGAIVGFGSLSPFRSRPAYATTVEDSVYLLDDHQGRGIGRLLLDELLRLAAAHGFHAVIARIAGEQRGLDRACTRPAASRSSAPSARSAASSASGSTWSRCSGCSEHPAEPRRPTGDQAEWAGLDSNQRSLRSRFTACPLCPLGYRPGGAYSIRPPVPAPSAPTLRRAAMPTFDVVSELDMQEVRNAVDQAAREVSTRFDFKNTGSSIELKDKDDRARHRERGAPHRAHPGARGEDGQAPGVAEGARLRQDRRGVEGRGAPDRHA